jgi:hypothetical protein
MFDDIGAGFSHVLDAAFGDQLNLFARKATLFEGSAKLGLGSVSAINIGMIKGGDLVFEATVYGELHFGGGEFFVPNTPIHGAGDNRR